MNTRTPLKSLTKVQRGVLSHLIDNGGSMIVSYGHRSTTIGYTKVNHIPVLKCSWVVLQPLKARSLITYANRPEGGLMAEITELGRKAIE